MTPAARQPRLTVFTIAPAEADACLETIRNLARQTARAHLELIVVATGRGGVGEEELSAFGAHQWLLLPEVRTSGEAMAAAVRAARAQYVTYAEEHGSYHEAWGERVIAAHEAGYDAVAFAMENAIPDTLTSWAHHFAQFGAVAAPVETAETHVLAGHHTSYRRDLLLEYGDRLHDMLEDEAALAMDLDARGTRMLIAGDALSYHIGMSRILPYMRLDYLGMRTFASTRSEGWSWARRIVFACGTPLVPLIRMRRSVRDIRRAGRGKQLLPWVLAPMSLGLLAGMWGEFLGYAVGRGDSARQRAHAELERRSFLREGESPVAEPALSARE